MKKNKILGFVAIIAVLCFSGISIYNVIETNKIKEHTIVLKKELKKNNEIKEDKELKIDNEKNKQEYIEKQEKEKNKQLNDIKQEKDKLKKELEDLKKK